MFIRQLIEWIKYFGIDCFYWILLWILFAFWHVHVLLLHLHRYECNETMCFRNVKTKNINTVRAARLNSIWNMSMGQTESDIMVHERDEHGLQFTTRAVNSSWIWERYQTILFIHGGALNNENYVNFDECWGYCTIKINDKNIAEIASEPGLIKF